MHALDNLPSLTPLQRAIYETDQLGLTLRDSIKIVSQRMGFFVGQNKYLEERAKLQRIVDEYGPPPEDDAYVGSHEGTHQTGSP